MHIAVYNAKETIVRALLVFEADTKIENGLKTGQKQKHISAKLEIDLISSTIVAKKSNLIKRCKFPIS